MTKPSFTKSSSSLSTSQQTIHILMIGETGVGKSLFGKALADGQSKIKLTASTSTSAGTTQLTEITFQLSPQWISLFNPLNPGQLDPSNFYWHITDTPGIKDPKGLNADIQHLKDMVTYLKNPTTVPVNVIAFVIPFSKCRFTNELKLAFKVFDAVFHDPDIWNRVCIIVSFSDFPIEPEDFSAWEINSPPANPPSFCDCIIELLHGLWNWQGTNPKFPVFFVNSRKPHGKSKSEIKRFLEFSCSRTNGAIDSSHMINYNPAIMRQISFIFPSIITVETPTMKQERTLTEKSIVCVQRQVTVMKERVVDRKVDALDILTIGIAWLFRTKQIIEKYPETQTELVFETIDRLIYEGEVKIDTIELMQEQVVTFDYEVDKIDTNNRTELIQGRTVNDWKEISRKVISTRFEWHKKN
jgi:ABC-type dipeptide/oligopeptide/nickel transport system ATPase component